MVNSITYSTFKLKNRVFAIDINFVQEVFDYPEQVIPLPVSGKYLTGLFNARETLIPMFSLAQRLNTSATPSDNSKLCVITQHHHQLALIFDDTHQVISVPAERATEWDYVQKHQVIHRTLRTADSDELLEVLDINEVFESARLTQAGVRSVETPKPKPKPVLVPLVNKKHCITFLDQGTIYGLPMGCISEIVQVAKFEDSKFKGKLCRGRFDLRGESMPVIRFSTLLNETVGDATHKELHFILVVHLNHQYLALEIDQIQGIMDYAEDELSRVPVPTQDLQQLLIGCLHKHTQEHPVDVFIIASEVLMSYEPIKSLIRSNQLIYPSVRTSIDADDNNITDSFLTFQMIDQLGIHLTRIKEVVPFDHGMLLNESNHAIFLGTLELMGKMTTIIDLRQLYGLPPLTDSSEAALIIIKRHPYQFGLRVDALKGIVLIRPSTKIHVNPIIGPKMSRSFWEDVSEIIQERGLGSDGRFVIHLDIDKTIDRIVSLKEVPLIDITS